MATYGNLHRSDHKKKKNLGSILHKILWKIDRLICYLFQLSLKTFIQISIYAQFLESFHCGAIWRLKSSLYFFVHLLSGKP